MDLGYDLTPEGSKLRSFLSRACVFVILSLPEGGTDHPDFTAEKMVPVLGDNEDLLADVFTLLVCPIVLPRDVHPEPTKLLKLNMLMDRAAWQRIRPSQEPVERKTL